MSIYDLLSAFEMYGVSEMASDPVFGPLSNRYDEAMAAVKDALQKNRFRPGTEEYYDWQWY